MGSFLEGMVVDVNVYFFVLLDSESVGVVNSVVNDLFEYVVVLLGGIGVGKVFVVVEINFVKGSFYKLFGVRDEEVGVVNFVYGSGDEVRDDKLNINVMGGKFWGERRVLVLEESFVVVVGGEVGGGYGVGEGVYGENEIFFVSSEDGSNDFGGFESVEVVDGDNVLEFGFFGIEEGYGDVVGLVDVVD